MTSLPEERAQLLLRRALELYRQTFARTDTARAWLAERGFTDLALLDRHHVGWCEGNLVEILPDDPALRADLDQLGLLTPKGRERLAGCVVFPIYTADGRISTLLGYAVNGAIRMLPDRPLPPWNLSAAKISAEILLTPDILDGLALAMAGHTHVLALHPQHGQFDSAALKAWGVQRMTIVHGDTPEALATIRALQIRIETYVCGVANLRGVAGAGATLLAHGSKFLAEAVTLAIHGLTTLSIPGMQPLPGGLTLTIRNRRYEVRGLQAAPTRMKATVRSERGGRMHVDTLDFYVARARRQLILDLVRLHEESADLIEADVAKLLAACELRAAQPDLTAQVDTIDPIPEGDRREAEAMGRDPKLVETILDDYERCGLVGERPNKLLSYLAMTSRKMPRPLAILNLSSSGTGKSALQDATYAFCPPEEAIKTTNLSAKALFHREKDSLRHKFLALEEGRGVESAAYALRILISSGELITEVATKDPTSGRLVAMRNRVEGPVAVSLTTTSPDSDPETRSRFFMISADESAEQTDAILELQRQQHTLDGLKAAEACTAIYRRHHAFQRLLQPLHVLNPLVQRLCGMSNRLTARRDQPKLLGLVDAVAFLRQMAKPEKQYQKVNYIEVDETDLRIAGELIQTLLGPGANEVSKPGRELLQVLDRMRRSAGRTPMLSADDRREFLFTRRQVREFSSWERTRVHRYLVELIDLEYVIRDRTRRGTPDRYILAWEGEQAFGAPEVVIPFADVPAPKTANG